MGPSCTVYLRGMWILQSSLQDTEVSCITWQVEHKTCEKPLFGIYLFSAVYTTNEKLLIASIVSERNG